MQESLDKKHAENNDKEIKDEKIERANDRGAVKKKGIQLTDITDR